MSIKTTEETSFHLENFQGPLHFLLQLVQKSELEISDISIKEITLQYLQQLEERAEWDVDAGAEFISMASLLLWLKSKMLLPTDEQPKSLEEIETPFSVIPMLLEHIRFKKLAKELSKYEELQNGLYTRGIPPQQENRVKPSGIEQIALEQLFEYFQNAIKKTTVKKITIYEEIWRVSDKIEKIRKLRKKFPKIELSFLFTLDSTKEELVVIFLAILELIKLEELAVKNQDSDKSLWLIFRGSNG